MSSIPNPETESPDTPPPAEGIPQSDPYPKMIIVCFVIFFVLIIVIFGVITLDMIQRVDTRIIPPHPQVPAAAPGESAPQPATAESGAPPN